MARRKTKAQKLASLRAKERAAKRTKPITKLDAYFIQLHEMAESMKAAGFDDATVQGWIVDRPLPDWAIENPDHFDDDDEEEDDY
jgi:hypothetical protein